MARRRRGTSWQVSSKLKASTMTSCARVWRGAVTPLAARRLGRYTTSAITGMTNSRRHIDRQQISSAGVASCDGIIRRRKRHQLARENIFTCMPAPDRRKRRRCASFIAAGRCLPDPKARVQAPASASYNCIGLRALASTSRSIHGICRRRLNARRGHEVPTALRSALASPVSDGIKTWRPARQAIAFQL